ncbi:RNA polymerase sigma factor [Castellaniella hirudinis]|uniref:RNA polymerase sigma factor n=1 Tax=Castellaniella hirudinis TaxID=1144617 RepID=UPI0039C2F6FB
MSRFAKLKKGWLTPYAELFGTWNRTSAAREDAEDAMHDTVLGILENGAGLIENPRAYLARGMANRLVSRHRHERVLDMASLHDLPESEHPASQGPDAGAQFQELADALATALETLPPKCRTIYILHRLEGRTHTEIAHEMGLSRSMIEKYMTRALRHLHAQLSHYAPY